MSQYTTIVYNGNERKVQIKLVDISGREVALWKYEKSPITIDRANLKAGLYIVLVEADGSITAKKKVFVE